MITRAQYLAARREVLLARSAELRRGIDADVVALAQRFELADRFVAAGRSRWAGMLLAAGSMLLVFKRPRLLTRWALRLLALYPMLRGLRPMLPHLARLARLIRGARDSAAEDEAG